MGPDGQLHESKDPNSPPCGGCQNAGKTDQPRDTDTSSDPNDGPVGRPGRIGGE